MNAHDIGVGRRQFLKSTALVGAAVTVGAAGPAAAQTDASVSVDLREWFDGVSNYTGLVDRTGEPEVVVTVGAPGNGGGFAFEPAAVRVDPGTTVVWEWTGEGGTHNVVDVDGAYESPYSGDAGFIFERVFDSESVSRYVCAPHEAVGMKGAVVVGDVAVAGSVAVDPDFAGWFDGVDNYAGVTDARGQEEVRITVGAPGNGGDYAFDPPAVLVDPGTTITWVWSGAGRYNVYDWDAGYESPSQSEEGATYSLVFDGEGISRYACAANAWRGMKGAIVVGDATMAVPRLTEAGKLGVLGLLALLVVSPAFLPVRKRKPNQRRGG